MKLRELIKILPGAETRGFSGVEVRGIAAHSRRVEPGYLFIAVPGTRLNGVDYVFEAIQRGAAVLAGKEYFSAAPPALAQIKVDNPRLALALLSNKFYSHPDRRLRLTGITGTNGKTTVAYLTRAILREAGFSVGLLGTIRYYLGERQLPSELTTPAPPRLQILLQEMLASGCSRAILEVSSHALKQDRVTGLEFKYAIFTNLSREHLDYHKSLADYRRAKLKLFEGLGDGSSGQRAILNRDDPFTREILRRVQVPAFTYGFKRGADLRASKEELSERGSRFTVRSSSGSFPVTVNLLGRHNIYNALAAVAVGLLEGVPVKVIQAALRKITRIPGRLDLLPTGGNFKVLIDYAHTPDALEKALVTLRGICGGRLIVIFGCGGDRDRGKRPRMGAVASRRADRLVLTSDNPRLEDPAAIIRDILGGIRRKKRVEVVPDRREAIEQTLRRARAGDVILIAGKGHEREQIFQDRVVPFNDREVAAAVLSELKIKKSDF